MNPLWALLLAGAVGAGAQDAPKIGSKDAGGCTAHQRAAVDKAKPEAKKRAAAAQALVAKAASGDADALKKVKKLFLLVDTAYDGSQLQGLAKNIGQMAKIIDAAAYVCAPKSDKNCGARAGYVNRSDKGVVVHLCSYYWSDEPTSQANTLVHESAHLLDDRIGDRDDSGAQAYCGLYDCESRCNDGPTDDGRKRPYFIADNWAHFVYCASGQPPQSDVITAGPAKK